jgi:large subunit ribosomal protein L17e
MIQALVSIYIHPSHTNTNQIHLNRIEQNRVVMTRYSVDTADVAATTAKARGSHLRVHFKHTREIAHHIKGMPVTKALRFMDDVLAFKAVVPFVKYTGGIGRKAQAKQVKSPGNNGRWPVKATAVVKDLLINAIANADSKNLDKETLYISHAQCNRAPAGRRRTYRAHGRIGKYASQPAHIEFILTSRKEGVAKNDDGEGEGATGKKITKKQAAKGRFVKVGGDQ